ncbi:tol-pal system YbgF family protein [Calditrichota bacterium]
MLKPRKRLVKAKLKEDKLLIFTARAQSFLDKYQKFIMYGVAGIVLIAAAAGFVNWSKSGAERKASLEALMARDAYKTGELDEALTRINIILEDYSGTPSAGDALMMKGKIHEQRLEWDEATATYKKLLSKYGSNKYWGFGALYAMGAIEHGRGNYTGAADTYRKAAMRYPDHYYAPAALIAAGEAYKEAHKYEDAEQVLSLVLTKYDKSRSTDDARKILEELIFMD